MYYLGIDLGTSAVKLLLMDEQGSVKRIVSKEYPLSFPNPGWAEQNPEDWWDAVREGIKELTASGVGEKIRGISFGGQMHGLVILDEHDAVIRPAILWNDGRTIEEVAYLNETIGREKIAEYTGNIAFAGFTAPKLLWLAKHEAEQFKRINKIMLPKDYIAYCLTGVHSTDYSDASGTLLLDVKEKCWSEQMLKICNIRREQLPHLYESYECIGKIKEEAAKELGLGRDCLVAAGAGDNAAAAIGTGTVGNGKCNISLGTSGTVFITSDIFRVDKANALHAFAHADGRFHLMGCMLCAASCNKWWMEEILRTKDFAGEQRGIRKLGENRVFFLPYLMGERSPHNDPQAKGAFVGMTLDTAREDLTQAVFEGVAFALKDSVRVAENQGIVLSETTICGGGAKSELWKKIIAAVLNRKIHTVAVEEGPAYGAAILAAAADKKFTSVEEAVEKLVKKDETIEPDQELVAKYEERYQQFRKLYPALKDIFAAV